MKVSVPTAYRREEPAKVLETGDSEVPALPAIPEQEGPPLPPLSAQWWQGFLHGNPDALLTAGDAIRAHELIGEVLGNKEASRLEIGASVR